MLFYASLFLFCFAFSAIVLWLYRSMAEIGKAAYRAFLPSSKERQHRPAKAVVLKQTLHDTATPWGWGSDNGPRRAVPVRVPAAKPEVAPWGWKGSTRNVEGRGRNKAEEVSQAAKALKESFGKSFSAQGESGQSERPMVGWPYREENFEFAGDQYKVSRKPKVSRVSKGVAKPWGW
jgi:hypothetical protein